MSLSNEMVDVLTYIEQMWWEDNGTVPTNEAISEATGIGLQTVKGYWTNPDFRAALQHRGVSFKNDPDAGKALTYDQLMVANMLLNIMDKRSLREKLQASGINATPAQVGSWMRQPAFQAHLRKRSQNLFEDADTAANIALVKAIDAGDLKAVQLLFEMTGRYTPRQVHEINVHAVLARVIEIISIRVKDPAIVADIAGDIDALLTGQTPQALPEVKAPIPVNSLSI